MYSDLKLKSRLLRNLELANVISLKPGNGQNIATHTSPTVSIFCFVLPFLSDVQKIQKWKTLNEVLKPSLRPWPWAQSSNLFTKHFGLWIWCCTVNHGMKFGCKGTNSSEDTEEMVIFWLCEPLTWKRGLSIISSLALLVIVFRVTVRQAGQWKG